MESPQTFGGIYSRSFYAVRRIYCRASYRISFTLIKGRGKRPSSRNRRKSALVILSWARFIFSKVSSEESPYRAGVELVRYRSAKIKRRYSAGKTPYKRIYPFGKSLRKSQAQFIRAHILRLKTAFEPLLCSYIISNYFSGALC